MMETPIAQIPYHSRGRFIERLNRFVGLVEIDGVKHLVHIHDPGRLKELLFAGNNVLLRRAQNPARKTRWDLLAAHADDEWVFVHSGYHRQFATEIFKNPRTSPFGAVKEITPEITHGSSRLDFKLVLTSGDEIWIETKGCTLAVNEVALFPDAPTTRGTRHMEELITIAATGTRSAAVFLVFRKAKLFAPNSNTDPKFSHVYFKAIRKGVEIYAIRLKYDGQNIYWAGKIPYVTSPTQL